jgi:hypothetical protein
MSTETRYRILGDIIINSKTPASRRTKEKKVDISYGSRKTTNLDNVAVIQTCRPLTSETPYFFLEVQQCGKTIKNFN